MSEQLSDINGILGDDRRTTLQRLYRARQERMSELRDKAPVYIPKDITLSTVLDAMRRRRLSKEVERG